MSISIGAKNLPPTSVTGQAEDRQAVANKTVAEPSSGNRLKRAADDTASLAVAEQLGGDRHGLDQRLDQLSQGLAMIATADTSLGATGNRLLRLRELAVAAAGDEMSAEQRDAIQAEFGALSAEIDQTTADATFNDQRLLDGSGDRIEVGVGPDAADAAITLDFSRAMDSEALGLADALLAGDDGDHARAAIATIDEALATVSAQRADYGSASNQLQSAQRGLGVVGGNPDAARSRIQDTQTARQTASLMHDQILAQASDAVTVQGRLMPVSVMNLLK